MCTVLWGWRNQAVSWCKKWLKVNHTHKNSADQGYSTWVTLLWYLPFSLLMLFCNCFLVELSIFEERERDIYAEHKMSTLFLQSWPSGTAILQTKTRKTWYKTKLERKYKNLWRFWQWVSCQEILCSGGIIY